MIVQVRFPSAVEVVKGCESRSTWQLGTAGIVTIEREPAGLLVFTSTGGARSVVYPLPGTVMVEGASAPSPSRADVPRTAEGAIRQQAEKALDVEEKSVLKTVPRAPLVSTADPPPARPIDKPSRKGR